MTSRIEGPLKLDPELFNTFLSLPEDPLPGFVGPTATLSGRGKDHPRYGRWMQAFVKYHKPNIVVEVGTNAGGTAVGIARALAETGSGRLVCVDNAEGRPIVFPDVTKKNILAAGLSAERFELITENSFTAIPRLAAELSGGVGIYLVDAAHTYDAAMNDMENGLPMIAGGGYMLVHDIDRKLSLGTESSPGHPSPVHEAFMEVVKKNDFDWCILKFIRKHLGVIRVG